MKTLETALIGASAIAIAAATPAAAQTREATQPTASAPSAAAAPATNDDEIVVTAQKRLERLQDVPVTLSVVTAAALERQTITNVTELQNASPELNYVGQPSAGYSIRGSGTQTFTRTSENNVLVVVDGVVQGQLTPPTSSLFDISRVEVLSGPQGILFGKNASAGVVNIVTAAPVLSDLAGRIRLSGGNLGYRVGNGLINLPIGGIAALRLTGIYENRDGTTFNRFNSRRIDDRKSAGVRGKLLIQPVDSLRITVIGDHELERGGNSVWTSRIAAPGSATSIAGRLAACGVVPGPRNTQVCLDGPSTRRILSQGVSGQVEAEFAAHTLTSITAYRRFERDSDTDSDSRPINALNNNYAGDRINQWSQELRIASPSDRMVDYTAGVFFYDYRYRSQVDQSGNLGALPFIATASSTQLITQLSQAAFGQFSVKPIEEISLIAGGRYTKDTLRGTFIAFTDTTRGQRFAGFGNAPGTASNAVETDNFSYRLGVQYRPSRDATLFATYSKGYKGPALNNLLATTSIAPPVVRPEYPRNIELGIKSALFDRRVNVDLSLFRTDVRDFQAQTTATVNGLTQFVFANASNLRFRGAQFNLYARPTDGLNLTAGVLYNKAKYGSFVVQCNAPFLVGCAAAGGAGQVIDVRGRQLANAPRWKITTGASYEAPLSDLMSAFVDGNVVYRSSAPTSATPDPNLVIAGYALVDARVGLRLRDPGLNIAVFAKNLTDKRAPTLIFRDPVSPTGNYAQAFQPNAFRTYGLTVDFSF